MTEAAGYRTAESVRGGILNGIQALYVLTQLEKLLPCGVRTSIIYNDDLVRDILQAEF